MGHEPSARPRSTAQKVMADPMGAVRVARALGRGVMSKLYWKMRGRQLIVGRNFRLEGRLSLRGPGRVVIGDNVRIGMTVTPWTYSREAIIEIGSDSFVNGTSFGCKELIRVGSHAILGAASIMDTNFHSILPTRHSPEAEVRTSPVILEANVWVAAQVGILPGTTIGRDSVVGFGSVCAGRYPSGVLIAGNPARVVRELDVPGDSSPATPPQ